MAIPPELTRTSQLRPRNSRDLHLIAIPLNEHTAHRDVRNLVRLVSKHAVAAAFEPDELLVRGGYGAES